MKEVIHEMYSKEQIDQMVTEIATRINKDYEGKQIHMICILRGSVFFCADLAKKITVPVSMDFMAASSYGNENVHRGVRFFQTALSLHQSILLPNKLIIS